MRNELVYVVHSEPGVAAQLSQALLASKFKVVSMTTETEADATVTGQQFMLPDAILTPLGDIESGDSILIRLLQSNPLMEQIPLVVVASTDKDERRRALRLGLLSVVFPPYDPEEVSLTTQLAIEKHRNEQLLFGSLSQLSVPDLLQTAEVGRRSGTISFQHNGDKGQVWLRDGMVVNAVTDDVTPPEEAVYRIILWDSGTFEANFGDIDVDVQFSLPPSELVLEAMRRLDEARAAESEAPGIGSNEPARLQQLEFALTLPNIVSAYTGNYLDPVLLADRLESVRLSMLDSEPELHHFQVLDSGAVILVDTASAYNSGAVLEAGARWCAAVFHRMDAALAWRFDRKRLANLLGPWRETLIGEGLFEILGLSGVDDTPSTDDDSHVLTSRERALPLGCFLLEASGKILEYGPFGPQMGRIDPERLSGQRITAVIPAAIALEATDLMQQATIPAGGSGVAYSRFDFEMGHVPVSVQVSFFASPVEGHVLLTINRVRPQETPLSPRIERDPLLGILTDGGPNRLLAVNDDFLCAFESLLSRTFRNRQQEILQRFGKQWGLRHALRVEQIAQHQFGMTLREVESHVALELLSGSIGILGLGTFEADLTYRDRGLIVVTHTSSPFPSYFPSPSEVSCSILAGFHAAILSYLAGRHLAAREVCCSRTPGEPCLFVIATEERLNAVFVAVPGSSDHILLAEIAAARPTKSR